MERMARMEENMDQMKNELKTRDQRISLLEEALGSKEELELEEEITVLRETVDQIRNEPYAFQCASSNISHESDTTITYDNLLYSSMFNVEGGFDITTGIFTAGYSGTWRITASAFMTLAQIGIHRNDTKITKFTV